MAELFAEMHKATIVQDREDTVGRLYEMPLGLWAQRLVRHDEGVKDGVAIVPGIHDGQRGRGRMRWRTAVVLDIETDIRSGEVPPDFDVTMMFARTLGHLAFAWTTYSSTPRDERYRIYVPLSQPIDVVEIGHRA